MTLTVPQVPLHDGGPVLSNIVAGVWRMAGWGMDVQARLAWIESCLALGITSFDHADIYGDYTVEGLFGEALAAAPGLRARLQLITKCGICLRSERFPAHAIKHYDSSAGHVNAAVERSLRALSTDHVDLLLIHRPDALMQPDELARCFENLQRDGKVLHFGVSNHTPAQFALLHRRHRLVTHQIELSPLQLGALADGTLDQCLDLGVRPMVWSPLGGGRLFQDDGAQARRVRAVLEALAHRYGVSPAAIAYAWILRHPSRPVPVTGSGRLEGLRDAAAGLGVNLTAQEWYRIWQASMDQEVP